MNGYSYTHNGRYDSDMRKKEVPPFVTTWVDLEGIMLSEISQTKKDKYCSLTHKNRKQKNSCQGRGGLGRRERLVNGTNFQL